MLIIKKIEIIKEGKDVEEWGGGWLVNMTFNHPRIPGDTMERCLNSIDEKMIDNYDMVLQAIHLLVNMQSEWLHEMEGLDAKAERQEQ